MLHSAILAGLLLVTLPPPLCRGTNYARYEPSLDRSPSARAAAEVQAAYDSLCPRQNCGHGTLYENPTIGNNAATWVSGLRDGEFTRAKIVYSAGFLDSLAQSFGDGASFGVLAHEVGHHLTAALALRKSVDSSWDEELRADYLAGCALGRSGRPPDELENALRALASVNSASHPSFERRNPVVRKGYAECRQEWAQAKPPATFGIGAVLRQQSRGCWSYWFRSSDDVQRVGPVAAPRRRSRAFESEAACVRTRAHLVESKTGVAEPCVCIHTKAAPPG